MAHKYWVRGLFSPAAALGVTLAAASPVLAVQASPAGRIAAGRAQIQARQLDSAALLLRRVTADSAAAPAERAEAWVWLGVVGFYAGDDSAAADAFRAAVALDPGIDASGLTRLDPVLGDLFRAALARAAPCGGDTVCLELEVDERPSVLSAEPVAYPEGLRQARVEGRVTVQAVIDTTGRAEPNSVKILQSPDPGFERSAKNFVLRSRFRPARVRGRAVRVLVNVPIDYRLAERVAAEDGGPAPADAPVYSCVPKCPRGLRRPVLLHLPAFPEQNLPGDFGLGPQGARGYVVVRGIVNDAGRVEPGSVRVVAATSSVTARAMEGALSAAHFRPGELHGQPVRVQVQIRYECRQEGLNMIACTVQGP
jgi:TonB family protein